MYYLLIDMILFILSPFHFFLLKTAAENKRDTRGTEHSRKKKKRETQERESKRRGSHSRKWRKGKKKENATKEKENRNRTGR